MQRRNEPQVVFLLLWLVFFFHGMSPGFWLPGVTNILEARGLGRWVPVVFLLPPICAMVSPLVTGALADHRMSSERLFGWFSLACVGLLWGAFRCLELGWHPLWYVVLMALHALLSIPLWGTLATVSMAHLQDGEKQYPLVRVGATFGWIVGGLVASFVMHADTSPTVGYAGAAARLVAAGLAFLLPFTRPMGSGNGWRSWLGIDAFALMKQRDHCVFFVVTALYSVPLSAFYMYGGEFLKVLGDDRPTGTMTLGQVLEIVGMFALGGLMVRYRVKTLLLWSLGFSVLRYGMSAYAGVAWALPWHAAGIALHGVSYTLYFVTAQVFLDRRVEPGMRGQAQGLLSMVSNGVGALAGALLCGWLRQVLVTADGQGWGMFWGILSAICGLCLVVFAVFYVGVRAPERASRGG